MLRQLSNSLTRIIAPPRCVGCLRESDWLCAICRQQVATIPLGCIGCGKAARLIKPGQGGGRTCDKCRPQLILTGVVSAGAYSSPLFKRGVKWLKFRGVRAVAPVLGELIANRLPAIAPLKILQQEAALLPVPLHKRRMRERGFNQSDDIARSLMEITGIPIADVLKRARATWTQTKLPLSMRGSNLADAFVLSADLPVKRYFILVDDVTTTGATLAAAAQVLQGAGAKNVWGVTAARG